ncbi:MAG: Metalloprotease PmbA [Chroococcopsis gigantea SAG 12.99]|jgi:PmbA protein|nr:TldD/PmbA family protein [Chlorogloea purpurea SAG 13.99]MDV2998553.1 Metalloprotease PmbA [Chroococcopsis gigantea SAG 12.99]
MVTLQEIAQFAQMGAENLGIKKYDIYGSKVDDSEVEVFQGEPKQVQASNRSSVIVRVWNDNHQVGVTTTTDVDPKGLELALKTAQEASYFGVKDNAPDFSPLATAETVNLDRTISPQAPISELIDKLLGAEKAVLEGHEAIESVPYNGLGQQEVERFYLNSEGAKRQDARSYASIYLYTKTEQEGKKPRSAGAYRISSGVSSLDVDNCLKEAIEKTISHLDYQPIKTGKYTVVFSPRAFLSLLGAFSNLFNAQSVLDKQSLSTPESIGTQIAVSNFCLCDDALHPDNIGAETFDSEGTPTGRVELITNGVLKNFLHSTITAKRMNARPTGNGNIGAKVTVSPHFYHVFSSGGADSSYSLENAENVVLIDNLQALHAGVNSLQGSFSLPFDGWLVNGPDKVSVDSATVAGDFLSLLKSIVYIEPREEITPGGISPRVWVEGLSITGE